MNDEKILRIFIVRSPSRAVNRVQLVQRKSVTYVVLVTEIKHLPGFVPCIQHFVLQSLVYQKLLFYPFKEIFNLSFMKFKENSI